MKGNQVSKAFTRSWRVFAPTSSRIAVSLFICVSLVGGVAAQPAPDPSLWTPANVTNPGGMRPVPVVAYDPASGLLYLDNRGVNGVSDTAGGTMIGGDDVGTISLLVRGPQPLNALPPFTDGNFDLTNLVLWSYQYFGGRAQLIGAASAGGQYIRPGVNNIFQYATGLTPADFQDVEMGINFAVGTQGATLFGSVQFVPEPMGWLAWPLALVVSGIFFRRHLPSGGNCRTGCGTA